MPFRYRLQKVLDFRIRKKEEQLLVVQKVQQRLFEAEENIRRNNEEIEQTKRDMRTADPRMFETYDNYLIHLWEKAKKLEEVRKEIEIELEIEKKKLTELEQGVKVLEKHKEHQRELYIEEEKQIELKTYSELGVTRYFRQSKDREEEAELEVKNSKDIGG
jgi:flagellar FliJ protein